jgi:hypothetical protein
VNLRRLPVADDQRSEGPFGTLSPMLTAFVSFALFFFFIPANIRHQFRFPRLPSSASDQDVQESEGPTDLFSCSRQSGPPSPSRWR